MERDVPRSPRGNQTSPHQHASSAPVEVLDPVCGMTIAPVDAVGHQPENARPELDADVYSGKREDVDATADRVRPAPFRGGTGGDARLRVRVFVAEWPR